MNKKDLALLIADQNGCTQKEAARFLDTFCEVLAETLEKEESIHLAGTGTFSVRERASRMARNPRTNTVIEVPASKVPVFKPGKALKDRVKGKNG